MITVSHSCIIKFWKLNFLLSSLTVLSSYEIKLIAQEIHLRFACYLVSLSRTEDTSQHYGTPVSCLLFHFQGWAWIDLTCKVLIL